MNFSVSGAINVEFGPSFGPVIEVPVDKGLRLTFRFISYLNDVP